MRLHTLSLVLLLSAAMAHAQRGGPPPGGGGPPGGGNMGGGNMGGDRPAPPPPRGDNSLGGDHMRNGPQLGPPGRWWDDKGFAKRCNLRPEQQKKMDDIFDANKGQLLSLYSNLQREEKTLSSLSPQELQDEGKVFAAIERVAQARADLEKENAHILMQIRKELDPQQLAALDRQTAR